MAFSSDNRKKLGDNLGQSRFFSSAENPSALLDDPMKRVGLALIGAKSTFEALEKEIGLEKQTMVSYLQKKPPNWT